MNPVKTIIPVTIDEWVSFWIYKSDNIRFAFIRYSKWNRCTFVPGRWIFFAKIKKSNSFSGMKRIYLLNILGFYLNVKTYTPHETVN